MTFTEAALAVLRMEGKPATYKRLAELAVKLDLLTHVGNAPAETMRARLSDLIRRQGESCVFTEVKPGSFALREWAGADPGPDEELAARFKAEKRRKERPAGGIRRAGAVTADPKADAGAATEARTLAALPRVSAGVREAVRCEAPNSPPVQKKGRGRRRGAARGGGAGAREDGADGGRPCLPAGRRTADGGGEARSMEDDVAAGETGAAGSGAGSFTGGEREGEGGRKRRRRRRGKKGASAGTAASADRRGVTVHPYPAMHEAGSGVPARTCSAPERGGSGGDAEAALAAPCVSDLTRGRAVPPGERIRRGDGDRNDAAVKEVGPPAGGQDRPETAAPRRHSGRGDLAGAVASALRGAKGSGAAGALTVAEIMREWAARRSAEADTPAAAVEAALARADAGRRLGGTLHSLSGGRWTTLESASGDEVAACEQRTLAAVTQQEAAVRRVLLRRLMELPAPAFHEAAISLLAAEGFRDIEPVAGPTPDAHGGRNEARLLRARASFGPAEIAAMVLVARVPPGKLVPSEQIALLRGRLPEVGACQGVIVTTGRIAESMHRDLVPPNAVPLLAIEQDDLLARLVRHGIGVRMRTADVPVLDPEAFGPFPPGGGGR